MHFADINQKKILNQDQLSIEWVEPLDTIIQQCLELYPLEKQS